MFRISGTGQHLYYAAKRPSLPAHYDDHDVIVAQISGEKDWYIHGCPVSEPTSQQSYQGDRTTKHSDSQIYGLAKGDIFYVPRGWMHEAISKAAHSIHITFGLHQPMLCDVVAELAQKASADQAFRLRRPLPISSQDERVEFSRKISQLIEHASAMMPYGGTVESNPSTPSFWKF
ncbi:hypothetical protein C8024_12005 [Sphingopyxis sp. BSNA05]|uniref:JmjC domain-containing protein n=1 Tax=Sphingopyxis sp. BSNA05 TaxID=1236614 RepID=UPI00156496F2|nr:hypothetical protein [Sphingopyxis sp. BSNA05]